MLAHFVNPYQTKSEKENKIQYLTFKSMLNAAFYENYLNVNLYAITLDNEDIRLPDKGIVELKKLSRTVNDIATFSANKPYPLIKDVLQVAYETSTSEYIIYTNVDIVIQPYFYKLIFDYINNGADALIINRRRVPFNLINADFPEQVLAHIGAPHPGFDCFVFKRELIPQMELGNICVGIPFIGVSLAHNLFALTTNCKVLTKSNLTAHIGLDVLPSRQKDYYEHNKREFEKIKKILKPKLITANMPYASYNFMERMLKVMLNPSVFTTFQLELEAKNKGGWIEALWNSIRFTKTQDND